MGQRTMRAALALGLAVVASVAAAGEGQWTGYVSDSHCRKVGASSTHTKESFEKCLRGGARPILWTDGDEAFTLGGDAKLGDWVGQRVRVFGTLNESNRTIDVQKLESVPQTRVVPR